MVIRAGHAEIRIEEAFDHLRETHFSWIGAHDDHNPFYYRIHSPVVPSDVCSLQDFRAGALVLFIP